MALIGFLICFLSLLVFPTAPVWSEVDIDMLKKGVVKITAQFANRQKIGTGFIAGKGKKHLFIVTASHVIEGEAEVPQSITVTFFLIKKNRWLLRSSIKKAEIPEGWLC